jgi:hypothetical protein
VGRPVRFCSFFPLPFWSQISHPPPGDADGACLATGRPARCPTQLCRPPGFSASFVGGCFTELCYDFMIGWRLAGRFRFYFLSVGNTAGRYGAREGLKTKDWGPAFSGACVWEKYQYRTDPPFQLHTPRAARSLAWQGTHSPAYLPDTPPLLFLRAHPRGRSLPLRQSGKILTPAPTGL